MHGRTPSQIRAAFHMQQDQVAKAAIEDIDITPPNEIDPLPTMPSLPPPSLEARLGKSVARSTKASPSLHYLDVKMEKKHGRLKSYTPDSRSRSTATASITKRSTASFLKLSNVRRKTPAIKKRAASLRKTAPLKTVPAIKSVKSIKSVRTKASPIVKTASFRVPSRRASPAASVTAKEIFVVDSKGKSGSLLRFESYANAAFLQAKEAKTGILLRRNEASWNEASEVGEHELRYLLRWL